MIVLVDPQNSVGFFLEPSGIVVPPLNVFELYFCVHVLPVAVGLSRRRY